jgi:HAD superfamily hydrolase (TIGR01549 family)
MKNLIVWNQVRGVIFDVDGTLYDQRRLRMMMLLEFGRSLFQKRRAIRDVKIINCFRKNREKLALNEEINISSRQLLDVANAFSIDPNIVAEIVDEWIYKRPLKYMQACRFSHVDIFFRALRGYGIKIGIFSDYPVQGKLSALALQADAICYSLESGLDRLKPQSIGLQTIVNRLNLDISECIFIGDRDSRDGECARRLGIRFVLCTGTDFYKKLFLDFDDFVKQQE